MPTLFRFEFSGKLDWKGADLLRQASGMRISGPGHDREPGQGNIGKSVMLWLSEGKAPDTWEIEAWTQDDESHDLEEVERRRGSIRRVLPQIADTWEEIGR